MEVVMIVGVDPYDGQRGNWGRRNSSHTCTHCDVSRSQTDIPIVILIQDMQAKYVLGQGQNMIYIQNHAFSKAPSDNMQPYVRRKITHIQHLTLRCS